MIAEVDVDRRALPERGLVADGDFQVGELA